MDGDQVKQGSTSSLQDWVISNTSYKVWTLTDKWLPCRNLMISWTYWYNVNCTAGKKKVASYVPEKDEVIPLPIIFRISSGHHCNTRTNQKLESETYNQLNKLSRSKLLLTRSVAFPFQLKTPTPARSHWNLASILVEFYLSSKVSGQNVQVTRKHIIIILHIT